MAAEHRLSHLPPADSHPHGTRARYVSGCRCAVCRRGTADWAAARTRKVRAAAADVKPSAPPIEKVLTKPTRWGVLTKFKVKGCPGANGQPCVKGGAWLRAGLPVCVACIDRALVWNGLVSATPARAHLLKLAAVGVGKHAVAAASDVAHTILCNIKNGKKTQIRAETERRILAVDEGARADKSFVPAGPTRQILKRLLRRGFTGRWISAQLGYPPGNYATVLQTGVHKGEGAQITARNAADVERLYRRVREQKLQPAPFGGRVDAAAAWKLVDELLEEGFTREQLVARLGFKMHERRALMREKNARAIEQLHHQVFESGELPRAQFDPLERKRLLDEFAEARNG